MHFFYSRISKKRPTPLIFLICLFQNLFRARTPCHFSRSEFPKMIRAWRILDILTWKFASRHNDLPFFDIRTWGALYILISKCASRHSGVEFLCLLCIYGSTSPVLANLFLDTSDPQIIRCSYYFVYLYFLSSNVFSLSHYSLSLHIICNLISEFPLVITIFIKDLFKILCKYNN